MHRIYSKNCLLEKLQAMKKTIHTFFNKHPKLSVIAIALIFGVAQVAFSFCSDTICPAFNDKNFDQWFPYKKGQQFIFSNGIQKDTITIAEVTRSEESRRSGGFGSPACSPYVIVNSVETGPVNYYKLALWGNDNYYRINVYDFSIDYLNSSDSGLIAAASPAGYNAHLRFEYPRNSSFNGVLYQKLEIISRDTTSIKSAGIYKIWLAPNKGVIAYEEYPGLVQWIKQ